MTNNLVTDLDRTDSSRRAGDERDFISAAAGHVAALSAADPNAQLLPWQQLPGSQTSPDKLQGSYCDSCITVHIHI